MNRRHISGLFPILDVRVGIAILLLATAGLLTACEYPGVAPISAFPLPEEASTPGPPQSEEAPPGPEEEEKEPDAVEPTPETPPLQDRVEVSLKDFVLDPDSITVKTGTITFILANKGRYTHDFRVENGTIDEKAPKVGAGRTFEWEIFLEPGEYNISCPISNHADRGMVGTLLVTE